MLFETSEVMADSRLRVVELLAQRLRCKRANQPLPRRHAKLKIKSPRPKWGNGCGPSCT